MQPIARTYQLNQVLQKYAVGFLWLVHVSAVIGIFLGYREWFVTKTPMNLFLIFVFAVLLFPLNRNSSIVGFMIFFMGGMISELIGVNTGILFGDYTYGTNLGPKIGGVPVLIGINWAILVLVTGRISNRLNVNIVLKALIGAALMVFLDVFIEPLAPIFDFWSWHHGDAPIFNFITWFLVAFLLQLVYQKSAIGGDFKFALHVYLTQLFFFGALFVVEILLVS